MQSIRFLIVTLLVMHSAGGVSAQLQRPSEQTDATIDTEFEYAFVISIDRAPSGEFTNASPPIVDATVVQELVGKAKSGQHSMPWDDPLFVLCGVSAELDIEAWKKLKIDSPPVGSSWIVYNIGMGPHWMNRLPDNRENRRRVLQSLEAARQQHKKGREEATRHKQELESKRQLWDGLMTTERIQQWSKQADVVAVAMPSTSSSNQQTFEVSQYFKGEHCKAILDSDGPDSVTFVTLTNLDKNRAFQDSLWNRSDRVLLFLSERPVSSIFNSEYPVIGAGVVLATDERIKLVKELTKKKTASKQRRVAVCGELKTILAIDWRKLDRPVLITNVTYFGPEIVRRDFAGIEWIVGIEGHGTPDKAILLRIQQPDKSSTLREIVVPSADVPIEERVVAAIQEYIDP